MSHAALMIYIDVDGIQKQRVLEQRAWPSIRAVDDKH